MGKGGVLGGGSVLGRSMKEVLAEAAERRMRDDEICHTHGGDVEAEVKKAQEESEGVDADQLEGDRDGMTSGARSGNSSSLGPDAEATSRPKRFDDSKASPDVTSLRSVLGNRPNPPNSASSSKTGSTSSGSRPIPKPIPKPTKPIPQVIDLTEDDPAEQAIRPIEKEEWSCPTCTLLNPITQRACEACTTPNPTPLPPLRSRVKEERGDGGGKVLGWYCDFCGSGPRDMKFWSCGECGWVRKWG
jgi:hypothetical protein